MRDKRSKTKEENNNCAFVKIKLKTIAAGATINLVL